MLLYYLCTLLKINKINYVNTLIKYFIGNTKFIWLNKEQKHETNLN